MLGELFACQLHHPIAKEVLKASDPTHAIYFDNPAVGAFLRERLLAPGALRPWNETTRFATGAELNARAFAEDFRAQ